MKRVALAILSCIIAVAMLKSGATPTRSATSHTPLTSVSVYLSEMPSDSSGEDNLEFTVKQLSLLQTVTPIAIAAGGEHTCALTTAGGVKCWGANNFGQLGDGTTAYRFTPVDVSGLTSGVSAIAVGYAHTCALTTAGGVKCWGSNYSGQLGDGTRDDRLTPVDVSGLTSGVSAIAAGYNHTCALTTAGGVKCWGANGPGQLGDGTRDNRLTPVDVSGLTSGVRAIAAGGGHTCALTTAGGVKCWGSNYSGQLGDGLSFIRTTPINVVWTELKLYLPLVSR